MKFYDAFAGVGGFHLGITRAHPDWECSGACEWDKHCQAVYARHFPGVKIDGDIRGVDRLPEGTELLCGGFPCQPFSIAGKRKGLDEERGTLFDELARLAERSRPRLLFFENVKGLLSAQGGYAFVHILSRLDELGYFVEWQVLNSKDFGVPQNRERVFIIGHLGGEPARKVFPLGEGGEVADGVAGEADSGGQGISGAIDANYFKGRGGGRTLMYDTLDSSPHLLLRDGNKAGFSECHPLDDGINLAFANGRDKAEGKEGGRGRVIRNASPALQAGMAIGVAQDTARIRRLTPKECERLQSFPDGWTASCADTQRYKMMGNAVTVNVIEAIARLIE